jgi:serine-type D-Ala-D-Ala carboxypeptidase
MKLRFEPVRKLCADATDDGTVPGLVLLVAAEGHIVFHDAFGARQLVPRKLPVFPDTLFDVASITKAVITSVLAMREVAAGRVALELPVVELLPEFEGEDRARVSVRHLLSHSSGLPAHRPFWRQAAASPSERRAISLLAAREPLEYEPGTRSVYSDLGFIVLGWLLERVGGERLDVAARRLITAPLGLESTTFMSLSEPEERARVLGDRSIASGAAPCADRRGRRSERDGDGRHRRARRPVLDGGGAVTDRGGAVRRLARRRGRRAARRS